MCAISIHYTSNEADCLHHWKRQLLIKASFRLLEYQAFIHPHCFVDDSIERLEFGIQEHPETVFSHSGPREQELARCALDMVAAFEQLLAFLVQPASTAIWYLFTPCPPTVTSAGIRDLCFVSHPRPIQGS